MHTGHDPHGDDGGATTDGRPVRPFMAWPTLARVAGRHPTGAFYDELARQATDGQLGAAGLLEAARARQAPPALNARGLAWFAHVTASRVENPERFADVAALWELGSRLRRRNLTFPQVADVWLQSMHLAGQLDAMSESERATARAVTRWTVETDALHRAPVTAQDVAWLDSFNRPFDDDGLERVGVLDGPLPAFDRLTCSAPPHQRADAPLVSVVVPVYNPGQSLRTAVASLLAQTWPNLEILLCDDASTSGLELIDDVARTDERVRVVRADRNAGAYAARNLGVGRARGEYVTFNDADDWAHPRKVQHQVEAIERHPRALASMSWSIRATEDLVLTVVGRTTRRVNLSSIMCRRDVVLDRLGGFDTVRKGADSEFVGRFLRILGPGSIAELTEPLSLVQLTSGSLSRDEYRFLRTHPGRLQYVAAFRTWHETLTHPYAGYVPPGARAPFPAPSLMLGGQRDAAEVDALLLSNLAPSSPTAPSLGHEVDALAAHGLAVGVREYLAPFDLTVSVRPPSGPLAEAFRLGRAVQLPPADRVRAGLVVVRDPAAVMSMPPEHLDTVESDRVLVVADYSPAGGARFDPADVARTLADRLTPNVSWLPATASIADELTAADCGPVRPPALFGAMPEPSPPRPFTTARRRVAVHPGVPGPSGAGRRDRLVPGLRGVEVVALERRGPSRPLATAPLLAADDSVDDVFAALDILAVGSSPGRGAHLHRLAVRALARGCVVIAPGEFRDHFGSAMLYLDEQDVDTWVSRLVDEPGFYAEISARGRRLVSGPLSSDALAGVVLASDLTDVERKAA